MRPTTPIPVPNALVAAPAVDLVIFGGSFNPVHRAHVELSWAARSGLEARTGRAAVLVVVPASRSPFKAPATLEAPSTAPPAPRQPTDADRVEMLRLAFARCDAARWCLWTDELDRAAGGPAPSYTVDTLRRARAWLDNTGRAAWSMRLLVGADQAASLSRWREPEAVVGLAPPLVMARTGADAGAYLSGTGVSDAVVGESATTSTMAISSTRLRELLASRAARGAPSQRTEPLGSEPDIAGDDALERVLDARVLAYIERHALYAV